MSEVFLCQWLAPIQRAGHLFAVSDSKAGAEEAMDAMFKDDVLRGPGSYGRLLQLRKGATVSWRATTTRVRTELEEAGLVRPDARRLYCLMDGTNGPIQDLFIVQQPVLKGPPPQVFLTSRWEEEKSYRRITDDPSKPHKIYLCAAVSKDGWAMLENRLNGYIIGRSVEGPGMRLNYEEI